MTDNATNGTELVIIKDIMIYCAPFTIALNALVLFIAKKYVNLNARLEQFFVVNMTLSDFLFSLLVMTTYRVNSEFPELLCRAFWAMSWTFSITSVLFLLFLNLHKLVTLFFPLHSMIFMSKRKVQCQILLIWITVLIVNIANSVANLEITDDVCRPKMVIIYYGLMFVTFYLVPSLLSLIISSFIFVLVQKKARRTGTASKERRKMFKRIFFVFTSTFWTAITCLPYRVNYMCIQFCVMLAHEKHNENEENLERLNYFNATTTDYDYGENYETRIYNRTNLEENEIDDGPVYVCTDTVFFKLTPVLSIMVAVGFAINPLITLITQKRYRHGCREIFNSLTKICGKKNRPDYEPANRKCTVEEKIRKCTANNCSETLRLSEEIT